MDFFGRHEKYIVYGAGPFVTTLMSKHVPSRLFPSTGFSPYFTHGPADAAPAATTTATTAEMTFTVDFMFFLLLLIRSLCTIIPQTSEVETNFLIS